MNRIERFSLSARDTMSRAQEAAADFGDGSIRLPHFLLAMLEKDDTSRPYRALSAAGLKYDTTRDLIAKMPVVVPLEGKPELSNQVKRMLEMTVDLVRKDGKHMIDSEHLLRGLLAMDDHFLLDLLTGLGTNPEMILNHLDTLKPERDSELANPAEPLDTELEQNEDVGQPSIEERINWEDRQLTLRIQARAPIEPGDWVARFPFSILLQQFGRGEEGVIRLVMENFEIEITFE